MAPQALLSMPKITQEQLSELPPVKQALYKWKRADMSLEDMTSRYSQLRKKSLTPTAVLSAVCRLRLKLITDYGECEDVSSEDDPDADDEDKDGDFQLPQKRKATAPFDPSGKERKALKISKDQSAQSTVNRSSEAKLIQSPRTSLLESPNRSRGAKTPDQGCPEDVQNALSDTIGIDTPGFVEFQPSSFRLITTANAEDHSPVLPSTSPLTASPQLQFTHIKQNTNTTLADFEVKAISTTSRPESLSPFLHDTTKKNQMGASNAYRKLSRAAKTANSPTRPVRDTEGTDEEEHWEFVQKHKSLINQEFDVEPVTIREALESIKIKSDKIFRATVRHQDDGKQILTLYVRVAQNLTLLAPDVVELITGSRSATSFINVLDPSFGRSRYALSQILTATFWGILTLRVFKRDLLQEFKVPGSYAQDSPFYCDLANVHADLDARGDRQAVMFRYLWRESRNLYLKKPAFLGHVAKHSESVLQEIENALNTFFPRERRDFPPPHRQDLLDLIIKAIDVKCRGDLSHFKCVWGWPRSGDMFDEETMDVLATRATHNCPFNQAEGMETWETDRKYAQGVVDMGLGGGWQRTEATYKSPVIMLDGPLHEAGPEWLKK